MIPENAPENESGRVCTKSLKLRLRVPKTATTPHHSCCRGDHDLGTSFDWNNWNGGNPGAIERKGGNGELSGGPDGHCSDEVRVLELGK